MYNSFQELLSGVNSSQKTISQITLKNSAVSYNKTEAEVFEDMKKNYLVMNAAIEKGLNKDLKSQSGLSGGMAYMLREKVVSGKALSGEFIGEIMYSALATSELNACMGKIVAAPTAGACGIIPACLITLEKQHGFSSDEIVMSLFNVAAIGMLIAKNASISGAQGGCQAECGSASAMAASAIVELKGGSAEMCGYAAAFALKNIMGLICDPVAGLVEVPCVLRNASCAVNAIVAADLALAGIKSVIPLDEVIHAMKNVSDLMPNSLKETAEGGIAATQTAKAIQAAILEKI